MGEGVLFDHENGSARFISRGLLQCEKRHIPILHTREQTGPSPIRPPSRSDENWRAHLWTLEHACLHRVRRLSDTIEAVMQTRDGRGECVVAANELDRFFIANFENASPRVKPLSGQRLGSERTLGGRRAYTTMAWHSKSAT